MKSLSYNTIRRAILGLMVTLAAVSTGYCDSYDADPYDDVPPVTLELNFVVPMMAGAAHAQLAAGGHTASLITRRDILRNFLTPVANIHPDAGVSGTIDLLPVIRPLRT